MKNTIKKALMFLLISIFSFSSLLADDTPVKPKIDTGLKFEVVDGVKDGGTTLRVKISGAPNADVVEAGQLNLDIPQDKVKTGLTKPIPVEMEGSSYDLQNPEAILQDPLYLFGVKDAELDESTVISATNFSFKEIAPGTDISSWIKFRNNDGEYIAANEVDKDPLENTIPRGVKFEVDELGVENGEDSIGIRVYGIVTNQMPTRDIAIDLPTSLVTNARTDRATTFAVSGSNLELSGAGVSKINIYVKDPKTVTGTQNLPLNEYTFEISLNFTVADATGSGVTGTFATFTDLAVGDDVSSWFSSTATVSGLEYKIKSINDNGGKSPSSVVIAITGTPTATSTNQISISIPRANITELKDQETIREDLPVVTLTSQDGDSFKYAIAENPMSVRFENDVTISGTVGVPYSQNVKVEFGSLDGVSVPVSYANYQTFSILLEGGLQFASKIAKDTDVTSWFSNTPSGLVIKAQSDTEAGSTKATLYVDGKPTEGSTLAMRFTVPKDMLVFTGTIDGVAYTASNVGIPETGVSSEISESKYAIYSITLQDPSSVFVQSASIENEITPVTGTVAFPDGFAFATNKGKGSDISEWFQNIWADTSADTSDNFRYTLDTDIRSNTKEFTFTISGTPLNSIKKGPGLIRIVIPRLEVKGAVADYVVQTSSTYSDVAEEYARLYTATPQLRIISKYTDFTAVNGFFTEFEVTYQLDNAAFKIDTGTFKDINCPNYYYHSWANDSLKSSSSNPSSYENVWTRNNSYYRQDEEVHTFTNADGDNDIFRGLGLQVVNATKNTVTVRYAGWAWPRNSLAKNTRKSDTLYLSIPLEYIEMGGYGGGYVTSIDPITIYYEEPILTFAPVGFYYSKDVSKTLVSEVEALKNKTDISGAQIDDDKYKYSRLSYDVVGVVGQPLSDYEYNIEDMYNSDISGNVRNEKYHLYCFSPINFDLDYNVGDDVTDLFFDDGTNSGITWKIVAKGTEYDGFMTFNTMAWDRSNIEYITRLNPRDDRYQEKERIYIVQASGTPNLYTNYPGVEITLKKKFSIPVKYQSSDENISFSVYSQLAPSYALKNVVGMFPTSEIENVELAAPSYNIFSLYVPFTDWSYSVQSKKFPFTTVSANINGEDSGFVAKGYSVENLKSDKDFPDKQVSGDYIPILTSGKLGFAHELYTTYANNNGFYFGDNWGTMVNYYRVWTYNSMISAYSYPIFVGTTSTFPGKKHISDKYRFGLPYDFADALAFGNYSSGNFVSGGIDLKEKNIQSQELAFNKDEKRAYAKEPQSLKFTSYGNSNQIFYIAFRPNYNLIENGKAKTIFIKDLLSPFYCWIKTSNLRQSTNKYGNNTIYYVNEVSRKDGTDFALLSPKYDFSLPQWLRVTASSPYNSATGTYQKEMPGIISSGKMNYVAKLTEPVEIDTYIGQYVSSKELTITLLNTTFTSDVASADISTWMNLPSDMTVSAAVPSADLKSITFSISGTSLSVVDKTALAITIPEVYTGSPDDLAVYTINSSFAFKNFSASVSGNVNGYKGLSLKNQQIVLTLSDGLKFDTSIYTAPKVITSWFTPFEETTTRASIRDDKDAAQIKFSIIANNGSSLTVAVSGVPTKVQDSSAEVSIPFAAISGVHPDFATSPETACKASGLKYKVIDGVSASIPEAVEIANRAGVTITRSNAAKFVVNLTNATFEKFSLGSDVSSWFGSSKKAGFNYVLSDDVKEGATSLTILVFGTPEQSETGSINITIPESAFLDYSAALTVDTKGSKYSEMVVTAETDKEYSIDRYRNSEITMDIKVVLNGGGSFIKISKGYNVLKWFKSDILYSGVSADANNSFKFTVLNAVNNGDTSMTIRAYTSMATANGAWNYDVKKAYTITIPKDFVNFATEDLVVDTKGGYIKLNNYTQPKPNPYVPVIEGSDKGSKIIYNSYVKGGWGLFNKYSDFNNSKNLKDKETFKLTGFMGTRYAKDIGDVNASRRLLFTIDNIKYIGHDEPTTSGEGVGITYIYTDNTALYYSQGMLPQNGYRAWNYGDSAVFDGDRTAILCYHGIKRVNDGYEQPVAFWYHNTDDSLLNKSLQVYVSAYTVDGNKTGDLQALISHDCNIIGNGSYGDSNVMYAHYYGANGRTDQEKRSFQITFWKEESCPNGSGCGFSKRNHGSKKSYIVFNFRVPVTDLAGNKVWVWFRSDPTKMGDPKYGPIALGHHYEPSRGMIGSKW